MFSKQEFIQEEYESFLDSIQPIMKSVRREYGDRATPGYVLLSQDKQPKQRNTSVIPITNPEQVARLDAMSALPVDIKWMKGGYFKTMQKEFWGKKTKQAVLKMLELKEQGDLHALGCGEFFNIVDVDKKNLTGTGLSLTDIESRLPPTFITLTPSGGKHYWYLRRSGTSVLKSRTFPCVDVLGAGKLVVTPSQYREGHGSYVPDTINKNFREELAYWDDSILESLEQLFNNQPEQSYQPSSTITHTCIPVHSKSTRVNPGNINAVPQHIKDMVKSVMATGSTISMGHRHDCLFYYCSSIADRTQAGDLLNKALAFNSRYMAQPLPASQVKSLVKWCLSTFGCYTGRTAVQAAYHKKSLGKYAKELAGLLKTVTATQEYTTHIEQLVPLVQRFYELRFGHAFKKTIPASEVGKILLLAGFQKKQIQTGKVRARLWNIPADLDLNQLLAVTTQPAQPTDMPQETPGAPAEAANSSNVQSPQQETQAPDKAPGDSWVKHKLFKPLVNLDQPIVFSTQQQEELFHASRT